jgi:hypothetical protein
VALRPVAAWVQIRKRFKFQGDGRQLAATELRLAGTVLEPARPETAGETPWGLASEQRPPNRTRILGLRQKRVNFGEEEPAEAPCQPMRLRQFRGLVSWG